MYHCEVTSNTTSMNSTENIPKNITNKFDVERLNLGLRCVKQSSRNLTTKVSILESSGAFSSGDMSETIVSSRTQKSVMSFLEEDSGSAQDSFVFKRSTENTTLKNSKTFNNSVCYMVEKLKAGEEKLDDYWKR